MEKAVNMHWNAMEKAVSSDHQGQASDQAVECRGHGSEQAVECQGKEKAANCMPGHDLAVRSERARGALDPGGSGVGHRDDLARAARQPGNTRHVRLRLEAFK